MKLYLYNGTYFGTQADLVDAVASETGDKKSAIKEKIDFYEEEVPVAKEGLLGYLNKLSKQPPIGEDQFTTVVERQDPVVPHVQEGSASAPVGAQRPTVEGFQKLAAGADKEKVIEFIETAPIFALRGLHEVIVDRVTELIDQAETTLEEANAAEIMDIGTAGNGPSAEDLMS